MGQIWKDSWCRMVIQKPDTQSQQHSTDVATGFLAPEREQCQKTCSRGADRAPSSAPPSRRRESRNGCLTHTRSSCSWPTRCLSENTSKKRMICLLSTIKAQNSWILPSLSVLMFTQSWKLTFHLQTSLTAPRYRKLCSACNTRDCMTVTLFRWRRDRFTSDPAQFCKGAEATRKCDDQRLTKEFDHRMVQSLLVTVIVFNKWATQLDTPQWQKNHPHHSFSDLPDRKKYMTQRVGVFMTVPIRLIHPSYIMIHHISWFIKWPMNKLSKNEFSVEVYR